jgi:DNA ligase-1
MNIFFERILEMIEDLNSTNSKNEKIEKLKKYEDMKRILNYIYDDLKVYGITSKSYLKYEKNKKIIKNNVLFQHNNIFHLLDDLMMRKITGHTALLYLYHFIQNNIKYKECILNIIDKSIKIRINKNIINKVFPKLINVFQPVLAKKYEEKILEKSKNDWYISRKLDGIRCICVIEPKKESVKFYSRKGKEFTTLESLKTEILISKIFKEDIVLDGEIISMENDRENFTKIMKEIHKKKHQITQPKYCIFDIIKKEDFFNLNSEEKFSERYTKLKYGKMYNLLNIDVLEQTKYTKDIFESLKKKGEEKKWEGLMLREDINYEGKRTKSLLKYKVMQDEEFKVVNIIKGEWREISKETKLEQTIETMVSVVINYQNKKVKVGSGFTLKERKEYYNNPEKIIGKIITVQYFEKTKDSLRFPIFKYNHGEKREL